MFLIFSFLSFKGMITYHSCYGTPCSTELFLSNIVFVRLHFWGCLNFLCHLHFEVVIFLESNFSLWDCLQNQSKKRVVQPIRSACVILICLGTVLYVNISGCFLVSTADTCHDSTTNGLSYCWCSHTDLCNTSHGCSSSWLLIIIAIMAAHHLGYSLSS